MGNGYKNFWLDGQEHEEQRRHEWAKVRDLLSAAMLMANAWDECGMPNNATRERMAQALKEFGK